jgi:hypothetical protein
VGTINSIPARYSHLTITNGDKTNHTQKKKNAFHIDKFFDRVYANTFGYNEKTQLYAQTLVWEVKNNKRKR